MYCFITENIRDSSNILCRRTWMPMKHGPPCFHDSRRYTIYWNIVSSQLDKATLWYAASNSRAISSLSPTLRTLSTWGVGRGLRTSNSLRPHTTVPTSCPLIHHPAHHQPEALLDCDQPPQSLGVVGAVEGKI